MSNPTDVLVVGGGPTGLVAANLLASLGVGVVLVERNATTSDDAKAISLDEESLRTLQLADLDRTVYPVVVPGTGTRYYGVRGQPLVHARGTDAYRFGHPFKNAFAQPELEVVLRQGLERFEHVEVRFGTELLDVTTSEVGAVATVRPTSGGESSEVHARYVLGCDGGRSRVRELASIPMTGRSFDEVWLVVDTTEDDHDQRYGMHHGDPDRPHVIVPGRDGRCRYEFLLHPGEGSPGEQPSFEQLRQLLRPHRELSPGQVERAVSYRFHALLADRFRAGRLFVLGDAAHMMPPFAGQGLNSGVRDAANLCWKLAQVVLGRASDPLLDTYEQERRAHARATINFSVRMGQVVMTTDRRRAVLRDKLVGLAMRTRPGRGYLTGMRFRPGNRLSRGAVVQLPTSPGQELVGVALPQPDVLRGRTYEPVRLDDALGHGFAVLGVDVAEQDWAEVTAAGLPEGRQVDVALGDRAAREHPGRTAVTDADGRLDQVLAAASGLFVLVRPDRVVAAVFPSNRASHVRDELATRGLHPGGCAAPRSSVRAARPTHDHDQQGARP